jgi:hypothetical protein
VSGPRFLFLELPVVVTTAGARAGRATTRTAWRLVAGNNHVLGRGPEPLADLDACRAALARLQAELGRVTTGPSPESRPGRWGWHVVLGREVLAVSSRWYERQRESLASLEQFLASVPVARMSETVAVRPRPREVGRADLRLPRTCERPDDAGAR